MAIAQHRRSPQFAKHTSRRTKGPFKVHHDHSENPLLNVYDSGWIMHTIKAATQAASTNKDRLDGSPVGVSEDFTSQKAHACPRGIKSSKLEAHPR